MENGFFNVSIKNLVEHENHVEIGSVHQPTGREARENRSGENSDLSDY